MLLRALHIAREEKERNQLYDFIHQGPGIGRWPYFWQLRRKSVQKGNENRASAVHRHVSLRLYCVINGPKQQLKTTIVYQLTILWTIWETGWFPCWSCLGYSCTGQFLLCYITPKFNGFAQEIFIISHNPVDQLGSFLIWINSAATGLFGDIPLAKASHMGKLRVSWGRHFPNSPTQGV